LKWAQEALSIVLASNQESAKKWEASVRNNIGMAYHSLKNFDQALEQFEKALALRKANGLPDQVFVAQWMIAWTLRAQDKIDQALAIQLRLEREAQITGKPDPYVFEELEHIFRAKGNEERARHYAQLRLAKP
jgi:tetratricopeptide (TPR) repeat protein